MDLTFTVVDPSGGGAAADVEVTAAPGGTLGTVSSELLAAVGRQQGTLWTGAEPLEAATTLGVRPC